MRRIALLCFTLSLGAHAASFDCTKASSVSEKLICTTPALSQADDQLAKVYREAKTASGNSSEFRQMTKENWALREQCKTAACLSEWYSRSQQKYVALTTPPPTACPEEGTEVTLTGKLLRITFPGPPNYESVEQGDEAEVYWVLQADKPVCADDAANWGDQAQMQLLVQAGMYKTHRYLIGQRVRVNGSLLFAETGHHHTPMMIGVGKLEAE
ncbi:DUF4431 domain-containing protein [Pantoea agglomerans]|uniref:DUF4431 domain-containing protein n=1 Tax=Enterobacter agglomerans TaxID=549 RepID=A0ACC5RP50_ENTAG|nr:DUF4431 domain-containing protein [Pantoea agglomerans]MBK4726368.1 DUF4431 domain-containing protein [Pantoea agglomerans]